MKKVIALLLAVMMMLGALPMASAIQTGPQTRDLVIEAKPLPDGNPGSGLVDTKAPELVDIVMDTPEVTVPGTVQATVTTDEDVSGLVHVWATFEDNAGNSMMLHDNLYDPEANVSSCKVTTDLNEWFQYPGEYTLTALEIWDNANNKTVYLADLDEYEKELGLKELPNKFKDLSFTIRNSGFSYDLNTSTTNPKLAEDIAALDNDAIVGITYGGDATLPKEVIEAIQGTDKTLILEESGIQWIVNGKDIDNADEIKDLDLHVDIDQHSQVQGHPAAVLTFGDNGKLPGDFLIRVKADYAFRQYIGMNELYVYYLDNETGEYVEVKANVTLTADNYVEFTIDHNSTFVITAGKLGGPIPPKPPVVPGRPSIGGGSSSTGNGSSLSGLLSGTKENPNTGGDVLAALAWAASLFKS